MMNWAKKFYAKLMSALPTKGVEGTTQVAHSMRALSMKEHAYPKAEKPLGRRDLRQLAEDRGMPPVQQRLTKNVAAVASPDHIEKWVDELPAEAKVDAETLTLTIGRLFGYHTEAALTRAANRAGRFIAKHPGKRVPGHIRQGAVMASAVMIAVAKAFPDASNQAAIDGVAALRTRFAAA